MTNDRRAPKQPVVPAVSRRSRAPHSDRRADFRFPRRPGAIIEGTSGSARGPDSRKEGAGRTGWPRHSPRRRVRGKGMSAVLAWDAPFLVPGLYLAGTLLVGAVVIAILNHWR